MDSDHWKVPI